MVGDRLNTDIRFGIEGKLGGTLAVLTGVNVRRVNFFVMTNMGFLAGVAAVVFIGRSTSSGPAGIGPRARSARSSTRSGRCSRRTRTCSSAGPADTVPPAACCSAGCPPGCSRSPACR